MHNQAANGIINAMSLFSPNPNEQQQRALYALRTRLLPPVLMVTAVSATLYTLGYLIGWYAHELLPWDGLFLLALSLICMGLMRVSDRGTAYAAAIFAAGLSQPFFYAIQTFGVNTPATGFFAVSIIFSGLFIGGWFLTFWTGFHIFFVAWTAWQNYLGAYPAITPITTLTQLAAAIGLWTAVLLATAFLTRLMARTLEQMVPLARGQTAALRRTLDTIAASSSTDALLREALSATAEQLSAAYISLFFHDTETDELRLHLAYSGGLVRSPAELGAASMPPSPAAEVALWQVLTATRQPIHITDVANDPRLHFRSRIIADGIVEILLVPLVLGERVIGHMSINATQKGQFWPEDIELAQVLAQQVTLGLRLNQLADEVAQQSRETAVIDERNRLARDIHDTLAQGFTGIVVQLEAAEDALSDDPDASRRHLDRARGLARESLAEARRSVYNLRPQALERHDLPAALREMVSRLTPGTTVSGTVRIDGHPAPLPAATETELLRIAQEAVTNALRHAQATAVSIHLSYQPDQLILRVQDNGRGFDPAQPSVGFGLTSMRERAMQINGRLTVNVNFEGGTEVICIVAR